MAKTKLVAGPGEIIQKTHIRVILSETNLIALLIKLKIKDSGRGFINYDTFMEQSNGDRVYVDLPIHVTSELDEEHYTDRPAGRVHPDTKVYFDIIKDALNEIGRIENHQEEKDNSETLQGTSGGTKSN